MANFFFVSFTFKSAFIAGTSELDADRKRLYEMQLCDRSNENGEVVNLRRVMSTDLVVVVR